MAYYAYGIDYTGGLSAATIDRASIDGHQIRFVIRYLSDYPSKNLSPAEAKALSAAGLDIVAVWEDGATDAEQGYAAGVRNARKALALARACGMPPGRPIFMCVDEDTTVGPHVRAYFQGAGSVLGKGARGAYADYAVIKDLFDEGLIDFAMQTYAWSGGRWDPRAQLQQYSNDHTIGGVGVDYDRATVSDYGQWRVGVTPTPTPQPQEEIDMAQRDLKEGLDKKSGLILIPKTGGYSYVEANDDNTYTDGKLIKASAPVTLRVAVQKSDGSWQKDKTLVVGRGPKDTKQPRPRLPLEDKNSVYVSITRVDGDGTEEITVTAY